MNYDKKDCDLIVCPVCKQPTSFSLFRMMQKKDEAQHLHVRCLYYCDTTFCVQQQFTIQRKEPPNDARANRAILEEF